MEWEPYPEHAVARYYDDLKVRVNLISKDQLAKFTKRVVLADGGIADNLGLVGLPPTEGVRYISNGGVRPSLEIAPWRNWYSQLVRVVSLIHDQPSQLRAYRAVSQMADYDEGRTEKTRHKPCGDGAYWHRQWPPEKHKDVTFPELNEIEITQLSSIPTRLRALDETTIMRLINWGYVAANCSLPYVKGLWEKGGSAGFEEYSLPFPTASFG